jgi:hypothetical protein
MTEALRAHLVRLFDRFRFDHDHDGGDCPDACYSPEVIEPDDAYQLFERLLAPEASQSAEPRERLAEACSEPHCADGMVPTMPDGDPGPCPRCSGVPSDPATGGA